MTYLRYISECDGPVKTPDLATRFGVDPSTITKTISELADAGLITLAPYHGASLSPAGRVYAEFLNKRHRILSLALTHFGLSSEEACAEVSRFESIVTRCAIDRMCRAMGHPREGFCGEITHGAVPCLVYGSHVGRVPVHVRGDFRHICLGHVPAPWAVMSCFVQCGCVVGVPVRFFRRCSQVTVIRCDPGMVSECRHVAPVQTLRPVALPGPGITLAVPPQVYGISGLSRLHLVVALVSLSRVHALRPRAPGSYPGLLLLRLWVQQP